MENQDKEFDKDPIDAGLKLDEIDPANVAPEVVTKLITGFKTSLAQKAHFRTKAIDPETGKPYKDLYATAKAKLPGEVIAPAAPAQPEVAGRLTRLEQAEEKRQFGHANSLSPEETDEVFAYANGQGIKPADALVKPFVKNALDAMRKITKNSHAIPRPSSRAPIVEGKSFNEMSNEDRKKNFGKVVESISKK